MTWRAIQSTVAESVSLAQLSDFAERLFWRMVAMCDPWGRLPGAAVKIRARCVPLLNRTDATVSSALAELERAGRILRYDVGGDPFVQIVDFDENQPADVKGRSGQRYRSAYPEHPDLQGTPRGAELRGVTPAESESESDSEIESDSDKGRTEPPLTTQGHAAENNTSKSTKTGRDADRPAMNGRSSNGHGSLTWENVHEILADRDDRTAAVISSLSRGLPQAALHTAVESLAARRAKPGKPLVSEARYFVGTLKEMVKEGQYKP